MTGFSKASHDMTPQRLVIAVLTYLRPADLGEIVPLLLSQASRARTDDLEVSVLVVDNDPGASAMPIVEQMQDEVSGPVELRYVHEPVPGISAGRNRALRESRQDDLLVFIDDDERPSPDWLRLLVATRAAYGADLVQGPVISEFQVAPDGWIQSGGFFRRRRMATGSALDVAVTNNLLLDLRTVRALDLSFDPTLGITGGEDTLFTRQLHRSGAVMVWCDEAHVIDVVPASRSTRAWVRQRALSMGNASALVALRLAGTPTGRLRSRLSLAIRGLARMAIGGARLSAGALARNERQHARGTRTFLRGAGMALGAVGYAHHEYARSA